MTVIHMDGFLDFARGERQLADATLRGYRTDVLHFFAFCDKLPQEIVLDDLRAWNKEMFNRNLSRSTIHRKIHALVTYWEYLEVLGVVPDCLPRKLSKTLPKKAHRHNTKYLSIGELNSFADTPAESVRDRVAWLLLAWLGLRRGELIALKVEDVDLANGLIHIKRGKGLVSRSMSLPPHLLNLIDILSQGLQPTDWLLHEKFCQWRADQLYRAFKRHCQRAGLSSSTTPHTLRHTFATHLAMRGVPLDQIRVLLGHRDLKSTQIYIHYTQSHLDSVLNHHPLATANK
jgi:site-specific recombinase XerD